MSSNANVSTGSVQKNVQAAEQNYKNLPDNKKNDYERSKSHLSNLVAELNRKIADD